MFLLNCFLKSYIQCFNNESLEMKKSLGKEVNWEIYYLIFSIIKWQIRRITLEVSYSLCPLLLSPYIISYYALCSITYLVSGFNNFMISKNLSNQNWNLSFKIEYIGNMA